MKTYISRKEQSEQGFTLVEVMVTMVIIGLLATVVVLNVLPAQDKAMSQKSLADVRLLSQAVEMYRLDMNTYPESLEQLRSQTSGENDPRYRKGGYIQFLPDDPWGRAYLYSYPGEHDTFDIWTLGADGEEGGEGSDADITSWQP
ncbi:MAG TPA: type II secretion system protein GspG [Hellea balneolensis]|uniref:Type II secretion system core protein G n=1 Tax=Hellea balneolensis TaxID=287478 RepID=A0A7C3C936_9PROT|nr:type II secretion system protein GspG [Hellea balneolensis]